MRLWLQPSCTVIPVQCRWRGKMFGVIIYLSYKSGTGFFIDSTILQQTDPWPKPCPQSLLSQLHSKFSEWAALPACADKHIFFPNRWWTGYYLGVPKQMTLFNFRLLNVWTKNCVVFREKRYCWKKRRQSELWLWSKCKTLKLPVVFFVKIVSLVQEHAGGHCTYKSL